MKDPCTICEIFITGLACDLSKCPVSAMKKENERLRKENERLRKENERLRKENKSLRLEMSYMSSRNTIGDCHEMGAW